MSGHDGLELDGGQSSERGLSAPAVVGPFDPGHDRDPELLAGGPAADVEDGLKAGTTAAENTELREAKKRIRLLEQENEVLRRAAAYLSQANLPGK